jgi:hypothetical protein
MVDLLHKNFLQINGFTPKEAWGADPTLPTGRQLAIGFPDDERLPAGRQVVQSRFMGRAATGAQSTGGSWIPNLFSFSVNLPRHILLFLHNRCLSDKRE